MVGDAVVRFRGVHAFLSNFAPAIVEMDGLEYPSVEHAYQAAKTLNRTDRLAICMADTPGSAKRLGQQVVLRKGWDEIRVGTMFTLLRLKFAHPRLRDALLSTKGVLMEGNYWHDNFWGVCYCKQCPGCGHNYLGRLLMKVRRELRKEAS